MWGIYILNINAALQLLPSTLTIEYSHGNRGTEYKISYAMNNICLVGSGGVGTIASLVLEKSGRAKVTAVLRSRYAIVKEKGWNIDSTDHGKLDGWRPFRGVFHPTICKAPTDRVQKVVPSVKDAIFPDDPPYDFVVVTTKQLPDHYCVAELIRPVITPGHTAVVLIQNGLDIEVPIIQNYPGSTVMSAISMIGSRTSGENTILQPGTDVLTIGPHFHDGLPHERQLQETREFVEMYTAGSKGAGAANAECTFTDDMPRARWQKLLWNGTFNTICTVMRMDVGELQSSGGRETLLIPAMWEMYAIAKAAGHPPPEEIIDFYAYRLPNDCRYRPSMLLDFDHGRPMELEVVLGNPLKRAKELGVQVPTLSTLYEQLKMIKWRMEQEKAEKKINGA